MILLADAVEHLEIVQEVQHVETVILYQRIELGAENHGLIEHLLADIKVIVPKTVYAFAQNGEEVIRTVADVMVFSEFMLDSVQVLTASSKTFQNGSTGL